MNKGTPTGNAHFTAQRRLDPEPNYSRMTNPQNKQTYWETFEKYVDRKSCFPWSDRTNIFQQERVVAPMNKFGTRFIDPIEKTVRYCPAGMLLQNLPKPIVGSHPTTMPFVNQFNTNL